jgi:hypothetical protein
MTQCNRKPVFSTTAGRRAALASTLALMAAMPAMAQEVQDCSLVSGVLPAACQQANSDLVVTVPVAPNQERAEGTQAPGGTGFSISRGETTLAGQPRTVIAGAPATTGAVRVQDLALDAANVQVKYDGLYDDRRLNVLTADLRTEFRAGEAVTFRTSSNYVRWIDRAEIRITPLRRGFGRPDTIVVPVAAGGIVSWTMPAGETGDYTYVLRVYDAEGRFDETAPGSIGRRDTPVAPVLNGSVIAAGEGEDRTALRNIPVTGGTVTVSGTGLPANTQAVVMGQPVPVDADGRFVTELVLPAGEQNVTVALSAPDAQGITLRRAVDIPRDDWFFTGLADYTIGQRGTSIGNGDGFSRGRLAFYAKGVIAGTTRVTASLDTGEDELGNLFDDLLTKDPRAVLNRIDADDLYPTYGDDSTTIEDAPTRGKVYLRVEQGDSSLTWGEFENRIDHSAYLSSSRDLYGAQGVYRSPQSTPDGERRVSATVYAAQPDSLPQRDELRGTGGSAYFLKRQDLVPASETVTVEIVDPVTGRVVSRRSLAASADYRIDYLQGTIILDDPLSGSAGATNVVTVGAIGEYDVNLVVQYEYVPSGGAPDGSIFGGRVEAWLPGDIVRLGFTGLNETTADADLQAVAADVHLRFSAGSYLEAEVAESRGAGFGKSISTDGGFTFDDVAGSGSDARARAVRIEGTLDLADVAPGVDGQITAYYETKDDGFTTLSEDISADQRLIGVKGEAQLTDRLALRAGYEDFRSDDGSTRESGNLDAIYAINPALTVALGISHLDEVDPGDADDTGRRTDLGFRLTRRFADDQEIYVFGQSTLNRAGGIRRNDRFGLGGLLNLSARVSLAAEISDGTNGVGARALLNYRPSDRSRYYLGYELDPNREISGVPLQGKDQGGFILGAERTINDSLSYYAENNYDLFGQYRSLIGAYGVTYTPGDRWQHTASVETGRVRDDLNGDFDRIAVSYGFAFDDGVGQTGKLRLEYRTDDHETIAARDRDTYALIGSYGYQVSPDWRFLANLDGLISSSDQADFLNGRYVEASLGYAYRPVSNDRLNLLARYTYLYDLPGVDQVSANGILGGAKQRSHLLSVDAIYEVDQNWELGGKLAYRVGETAARDSNVFTGNDAGLIALRASYTLVQDWELSAEGRMLVLPDSNAREFGGLATVYKSIGDNAKIGIGYNFGIFSDDLRDLTLDDRGLFLNLQAKF